MNVLSKRLLTLGASGVVAITGGYVISPWEWKENQAYRDIVGVATVYT